MRRKINLVLSIFIVGVLLLCVAPTFAKGPTNTGQLSFHKATALNPTRTLSNINNWSYWMYYDGQSGIDPDGNAGGIYPRGTAGVIFEDGFVWGLKVNEAPQIRVGGQTYEVGTKALLDHIYRIRSDWRTLTPAQVLQDAAEFFRKQVGSVTNQDLADIIEQYELDWRNWPVDQGAPWTDVNGDGVYDPDVDEAGIANADQVVYIRVDDSDPGATTNLYGSPPIGIELQVTAWGYNQPTARLGQIIFKKYKIINKRNENLNDMYVAQWCDPDVGNYSDDVVGSDSVLSLGFAYNGSENDDEFASFGLAPAAMGYDFFQGPMLPGQAGEDLNNNGVDDAEDFAVFDLQRVGPGFINLPMTSFGYFSAGNQEWDDPDLGIYDGTLQWYNLLRGFITNTNVDNPTPFTHRATGKPTKFPLNGDPVTGTGDIDGTGANFAPADRRMSLSTGPFTMAPGETQEVVVAIIGGLGNSRTQSVADVKLTDEIAQQLYDNLFGTIPKPPAPPNVRVTPLENEIVLNWGWDEASVKATEEKIFYDSDTTGYAFEGYNLYQLPSATASKDQGVLIATFDLVNGVQTITGKKFLPEFGADVEVPLQFGKDTGIQRYFVIDRNYITGEALFPSNTYYFAVTAYNYNDNPQLIEAKTLESPVTAIPVRTQSPPPGKKYTVDPLTDITAERVAGASDGQVSVTVVDPASVTGHKYQIFFATDEDTTSATFGEILWGLMDVTDNVVKLSKQPQAASLAEASDAPVVDGLQIRVSGPPAGIKAIVQISNRNGPLSDEDMDDAGRPFGGNSVWHSLSAPSDLNRWYMSAGGGDGNIERMARSIENANAHDFEVRFTDQDSSVYLHWYGNDSHEFLPLTAWDVGVGTYDDASDDFRLLTGGGVVEGGFANFAAYADPWAGYPATDWLYLRRAEPYGNPAGSYDAYATEVLVGPLNYDFWGNTAEVIARTIFCDFGGGGTLPEAGTTVRWVTNKPNSEADVWEFTAPQVESGIALERADAERLTVYPNPYYAFNPQEPDRFTKQVTFYHLPAKAEIRIFDLAGNQVRKLERPSSYDDGTTQFMNWDLKNEKGLPVASGVYIARAKMTLSDGSTVTKVLKIFIVQERQILEFF